MKKGFFHRCWNCQRSSSKYISKITTPNLCVLLASQLRCRGTGHFTKSTWYLPWMDQSQRPFRATHVIRALQLPSLCRRLSWITYSQSELSPQSLCGSECPASDTLKLSPIQLLPDKCRPHPMEQVARSFFASGRRFQVGRFWDEERVLTSKSGSWLGEWRTCDNLVLTWARINYLFAHPLPPKHGAAIYAAQCRLPPLERWAYGSKVSQAQ